MQTKTTNTKTATTTGAGAPTTRGPGRPRRKAGQIDLPEGLTPEVLEAMTRGIQNPADVNALLAQLNKAVLEKMLHQEMQQHLGGRAPGAKADPGQPNRRNGTTSKTLRGELGNVTLDVPRDRDGSFEPVAVPKHERSLGTMESKILALYAKGMSSPSLRGVPGRPGNPPGTLRHRGIGRVRLQRHRRRE